MTVQAMCTSAGVSRAGLYRHRNRPEVPDQDMELRDAIQKIGLEWPAVWPAAGHGRTETARLAGEP